MGDTVSNRVLTHRISAKEIELRLLDERGSGILCSRSTLRINIESNNGPWPRGTRSKITLEAILYDDFGLPDGGPSDEEGKETYDHVGEPVLRRCDVMTIRS